MAGGASRYGLFTPILFKMPGVAGDWEETASLKDLVALAQAADRLGYDYLTCGEHVAMSQDQGPARGTRYYDPLPTFGYLAAVTERIRLATYVLVLGYNHPLAIAKRYGTLDLVSGGRLVLGLGVGSLKPEFDLLGLGGREFEERGARGDDAIRALKASLGRRTPEYHGQFYDFQDYVIDPCAPRTDVPLWIGGRSQRSLRRAVELADGWAPFGPIDQLAEWLKAAQDQPAWAERKTPLEVIHRTDNLALDPIAEPGQAADGLRKLFAAGGTKVNISMSSRSCAHYIEKLEALAALDV
jgi:probable F420-dependent oxidoreductase